MIFGQKEARYIKPTLPDTVVGGLLTVSSAQILPLPSGSIHSGYGGDNDYWLAAVIMGSFTVTSHGQYSVLDPGQVLVLYHSGSFTVQSVNGGLCMLVQLRGEVPDRLLRGKLEDGAALFPKGGPAVREAVLAMSVLEEEHPPVSGVSASAYAYTMLTKLISGKIIGPNEDIDSLLSPLIESAIAIIQEEFPFLEGLDELAERLEVSKPHLIRTFTQRVGMSPGKYITRVRVEYAKLLLCNEDASIAYVAEACGFANANYFAKAFRRETGMSPSEYLESAPQQEKGRIFGHGPLLW